MARLLWWSPFEICSAEWGNIWIAKQQQQQQQQQKPTRYLERNMKTRKLAAVFGSYVAAEMRTFQFDSAAGIWTVPRNRRLLIGQQPIRPNRHLEADWFFLERAELAPALYICIFRVRAIRNGLQLSQAGASRPMIHHGADLNTRIPAHIAARRFPS